MGTGANRGYIVDEELRLQDAVSNVTTSASGEIAGTAQVIDLGAAYVEGDIVFDINTLDFTTEDETYQWRFQLSTSATFASDIVDRCILRKGDAVTPDDVDKTAVGRETMPFNNEFNGSVWRYCRIYFTHGGTTPIFNGEVWLAKR